MAEATVAAVAGILHIRLVTGEAPPFIGLLGALADVVLSPYLNAESLQPQLAKAQRLGSTIATERTTPPPPAPSRADVEIPRSVRSLSAYRARGCLLHIAEHPGASNTQVADATGVRYQGQMLTLLARLEGEDLLVKRSKGRRASQRVVVDTPRRIGRTGARRAATQHSIRFTTAGARSAASPYNARP